VAPIQSDQTVVDDAPLGPDVCCADGSANGSAYCRRPAVRTIEPFTLSDGRQRGPFGLCRKHSRSGVELWFPLDHDEAGR
jgi:hypothetical protein